MSESDRGKVAAEAAEWFGVRLDTIPRYLLVLGSGLQRVADSLSDPVHIAYDRIPGFATTTVAGHPGSVVAGHWDGTTVAVLRGRFHLYEGWSSDEVAFPIRVFGALGVRSLIVTNAAGAVNPRFEPGDLMLIADHLNFMFRNPLGGPVHPGEERFPDMSEPYDRVLRAVAGEVAASRGIRLVEGVYAAVLGPSYETPAEIRMLARLGADAIGMSTVPEVLVARALGMRVLGISCITNVAAGRSPVPLSHAEVLEVGRQTSGKLAALVEGVVRASPPEQPVHGEIADGQAEDHQGTVDRRR